MRAICEGIDMECFTVDRAYPIAPGVVALDEIKKRAAFVAIATRRTETADHQFKASDAVREEIAYAHAFGKNIVLIKEAGVVDDGMNRVADLTFDRSDLHKPDFLKKLVTSLHEAKMKSVQSHELLLEQAPPEFFAEEMFSLRELIPVSGGFEWHFSTTRRLRFSCAYDRPIKYGAWPAGPVAIRETDPAVVWECHLGQSSKGFALKVTEIECDPAKVDLRLSFEPTPQPDDFVTFTIKARSKYFAPIFKPPTGEALLTIKGRDFHALSGCVPAHRVQKLRIRYVFPENYPLHGVLEPFAAVYLNRVDGLLDGEIGRIKSEVEESGGKVFAKLEIEEPLVGYAYGFAWNPPISGSDAYNPPVDKVLAP